MKNINNKWVDDYNNSWSDILETEESAQQKSTTLNGCQDCQNCQNCQNCRDCRGCQGCWGCQNCQDCRGCWDCRDCRDCQNCQDCQNCRDCRDCRDCLGCQNCQYFKINPQRYVTPFIGSRNSQTIIYWNDEQIQIICGCFNGNLEQFELQVQQKHGNSKYGKQYQAEITKFKYLIGK